MSLREAGTHSPVGPCAPCHTHERIAPRERFSVAPWYSSCHAHGAPVEALQLAVVKPKLLYRRSLDCHELSLYGSINLNAVNLMSLLLMPLVQKFDVYAS